MATLRIYEDVFSRDLARVEEHLRAHDAEHIEERLGAIFEALGILRQHPLMGRPVANGARELVIGQGSRGYVALYRDDRLDDAVDVLAVRAQREQGFAGR